LRNEFLADLGASEEEASRRRTAQAAAQGQRGGIPLDIATRQTRDFSRARASGLADIDIRDLEGRREDINRAFYAQPEFVQQGTNIRNQRAAFDAQIYGMEQPTFIEEPQDNLLPALATAAGTIAGAYYGGPLGAQAGGTLADAFVSRQPSRSLLQNYNYFDPISRYRRGFSPSY
jgi:hypothetical protein